jgi:hypothetical protein
MTKFQKMVEKINAMIEERDQNIYPAQVIDRKTYWSAESFALVAQTKDLRWDYACMMNSKWPGGTLQQWIEEKLHTHFRGRRIDYARGENKLTTRFPEIMADPELFFHYDYFHTPNADHYPIPKSLRGPQIFSNCVIRPKGANVMRQNFEGVTLREAVIDLIESYGVDLNIPGSSKGDSHPS